MNTVTYCLLSLLSLVSVGQAYLRSKEDCMLIPDVGRCRGHFMRYFYNDTSGNCEQFLYGGCRGNLNNFYSEIQCIQFCKTNGKLRSVPPVPKDIGDPVDPAVMADYYNNVLVEEEHEGVMIVLDDKKYKPQLLDFDQEGSYEEAGWLMNKMMDVIDFNSEEKEVEGETDAEENGGGGGENEEEGESSTGEGGNNGNNGTSGIDDGLTTTDQKDPDKEVEKVADNEESSNRQMEEEEESKKKSKGKVGVPLSVEKNGTITKSINMTADAHYTLIFDFKIVGYKADLKETDQDKNPFFSVEIGSPSMGHNFVIFDVSDYGGVFERNEQWIHVEDVVKSDKLNWTGMHNLTFTARKGSSSNENVTEMNWVYLDTIEIIPMMLLTEEKAEELDEIAAEKEKEKEEKEEEEDDEDEDDDEGEEEKTTTEAATTEGESEEETDAEEQEEEEETSSASAAVIVLIIIVIVLVIALAALSYKYYHLKQDVKGNYSVSSTLRTQSTMRGGGEGAHNPAFDNPLYHGQHGGDRYGSR